MIILFITAARLRSRVQVVINNPNTDKYRPKNYMSHNIISSINYLKRSIAYIKPKPKPIKNAKYVNFLFSSYASFVAFSIKLISFVCPIKYLLIGYFFNKKKNYACKQAEGAVNHAVFCMNGVGQNYRHKQQLNSKHGVTPTKKIKNVTFLHDSNAYLGNFAEISINCAITNQKPVPRPPTRKAQNINIPRMLDLISVNVLEILENSVSMCVNFGSNTSRVNSKKAIFKSFAVIKSSCWIIDLLSNPLSVFNAALIADSFMLVKSVSTYLLDSLQQAIYTFNTNRLKGIYTCH